MLIRPAQPQDLPSITDIYNATILAGPTTAQLDPVTDENRRHWFESSDRGRFPVYVAGENGSIIGFLSFNPYRPGRRALDGTVELSYFVHPDHQGQGVATRLMQRALAEAPGLGFSVLMTILLESNSASIALLEKFDFQRWGYLPGVAEIQDQRVGQYYYGLSLS